MRSISGGARGMLKRALASKQVQSQTRVFNAAAAAIGKHSVHDPHVVHDPSIPPHSVLSQIAVDQFNDDELRYRLDAPTFEAWSAAKEQGKTELLTKDVRNQVAQALKAWAISRGAEGFAHWFTPMRGSNGEKHDTFIDLNFSTGDIKVHLSGTRLFQGETDGSSFPNGGLRATHTAAAFTAWDISSPPFVRNKTLFVPTSFVTWNGDAIDNKTPLLRSQRAVSDQSVRLLRLLGDNDTQRVDSNVGWEQEFFIVDREKYLARPDLVACGRTLIGAAPPRGQQTDANYFGRVPPRVRAYMEEVREHLLRLGCALSVLHNEVAPSQYEISPIFSVTNVASDQNNLSMELLHEIAHKHGLVCLMHEKPFANLNGSGKHNNWGLNLDNGDNLFVPGKTQAEQERFMVFVAALSHTFDEHAEVLRASVACAGNDHRLGAQEAPPAIMTLGTGMDMEAHIDAIIEGGPLAGYLAEGKEVCVGSNAVPPITAGAEDRNRTAPFPFCGNRFEFRAVGSTQDIAFPLAFINTAVADSLSKLADRIEGGESVRNAVAHTFKTHKRAIFNGDGYSSDWPVEAARRGLPNHSNSVAALDALVTQKNEELFEAQKVYSKEELHARTHVMYEQYTETLRIEANCLLDMMNTAVIPAALQHHASTSQSGQFAAYTDKQAALFKDLISATEELESAVAGVPDDASPAVSSRYCLEHVKPLLEKVRALSDEAEKKVAGDLWPYPNYQEMLFDYHCEDVAEGINLAAEHLE